MFYSLEQNIIVAMNHAEELLNERALKWLEHHVVQNELQASLVNDLVRTPRCFKIYEPSNLYWHYLRLEYPSIIHWYLQMKKDW